MTTILETLHGSRLYGLAHADSDYDTYQVVLRDNRRFTKQKKAGDDDRMTISLDRFVEQVSMGVPQALEALYSPLAEVDSTWAPFLRSLRPGLTEVQMRYRRTIANFGFHRGGRTGAAAANVDERKMRRHALRLCFNLEDFLTLGCFNPQLDPLQVAYVKAVADADDFESKLQSNLEHALSSVTR